MRLQQLRLHPYRLALRKAWVSASGRFTERQGYLVVAQDDAGRCGYGDCAPLTEAGTENTKQAHTWLNDYMPSFKPAPVDTLLKNLPAPQDCPPAARCSLETALLDLLARQQQQPLYRWLEPGSFSTVKVNASLGSLAGITAGDIQAARGYSVLKLKLGLAPVKQEIGRLETLVESLSSGVRLRLDANQAWTFAEAEQFIESTRHLPIESLEEPLAEPELAQLHTLQAHAGFPLALDESLTRFPVEHFLSHKPVTRLVLKPMVLGGLLPALALERKAARAGVESVITTTVDSAVGTWAAAHLAAAINVHSENLHHGLATSQWLVQDIARAPCIRNGEIRLDNHAGLGIQPRI
jgi:o-succinylbenzoate synthase